MGLFDISNFRAHLDNFGGPGRSALFRVNIALPPDLQGGDVSARTLSMFCTATSLPGVRIATKANQRYGIGPAEKMAIGFDFSDITLQFIADADGAVLDFFNMWTRGIVEYSSEGVVTDKPQNKNQSMDSLPYYVNYKQNYQTDIDIITYAPNEDSGYTVTLMNAFPIDIGDVQLRRGNLDQVTVLPVRFSFTDTANFGDPLGSSGFISSAEDILQTVSSTANFIRSIF